MMVESFYAPTYVRAESASPVLDQSSTLEVPGVLARDSGEHILSRMWCSASRRAQIFSRLAKIRRKPQTSLSPSSKRTRTCLRHFVVWRGRQTITSGTGVLPKTQRSTD